MRWEDERYVRFYTRDTPEFLALSWLARGLFGLILRKVDRAGILPVGKLGLRGVAVAVGGPWAEIEAPLRELLEDGCVVFDEPRAAILLPNFMAAQDAPQSDAARKRASREKARAEIGGSASASEKARMVTNRDPMTSQNVTESHERSQAVTSGHSVPSRAVPSRADPSGGSEAPGAPALPPAEKPKRPKPEAAKGPRPESPEAVVWRVWRELYAGPPHRRAYAQDPGDGKLVASYARSSAEQLRAEGRPSGDLEPLVRHQLRLYLADVGSRDFPLRDHGHALRFLARGVPSYGTPWAKGAAAPPREPPAISPPARERPPEASVGRPVVMGGLPKELGISGLFKGAGG